MDRSYRNSKNHSDQLNVNSGTLRDTMTERFLLYKLSSVNGDLEKKSNCQLVDIFSLRVTFGRLN